MFAKERRSGGCHGQSESMKTLTEENENTDINDYKYRFQYAISVFLSLFLSDFSLQEDQTPLHIASRLGQIEIVQLLLQHMAHPDASTTNGYTPLHISAREGQLDTAAVLLEAGASHSLATKVGLQAYL